MNIPAEQNLALLAELKQNSYRWLVTGAAGFIGSNLVEFLLKHNQRVVGLDNFATGHKHNLASIEGAVGAQAWKNFTFQEADIRDADACFNAVQGVDYVLHQAALGSVPRSVADPITSNDVNINGFLNMIDAAKDAGVKRFIYAASSSTYGDEPNLPKVEDRIGNPLSPYAVTKLVNELYAGVYARTYGFKAVGLRYFNVFGKRQDPNGAYAAVIPKWIAAMMENQPITINGDGETSRDFCYIANVVQANVKAALAPEEAQNEVYNVAAGRRTTLNELFVMLCDELAKHGVAYDKQPDYQPFRKGDVRHSLADVSKAEKALTYQPTHHLREGLVDALSWYVADYKMRIAA